MRKELACPLYKKMFPSTLNLKSKTSNGLKSVATRSTEPTALHTPHWRVAPCLGNARVVGSGHVVARDFNPGDAWFQLDEFYPGNQPVEDVE